MSILSPRKRNRKGRIIPFCVNEKKTTDKKENSVNLSNNQHTKNQSNSGIPLNSLINFYCPMSRIITWCLHLRESYKDTQVRFIPEEGPVASTLNESLEHFCRAPIWALHAFANDLNSFHDCLSVKINFLHIELCPTIFWVTLQIHSFKAL